MLEHKECERGILNSTLKEKKRLINYCLKCTGKKMNKMEEKQGFVKVGKY